MAVRNHLLERSSLEAYGALFITVVVTVIDVTWWLKSGLVLLLLAAWADIRAHSKYTHQWKKKNKVWLWCIGSSVLVALFWIPIRNQRLKELPIVAYPAHINMKTLLDIPYSPTMRGKLDLTVYDRGDNPYYQVWTKIEIDSPIPVEYFNVDFPSLEQRIAAGEDSHSVALLAMCNRGRFSDQKQGFLCVTTKMNPKETFPIKLTTTYDARGLNLNTLGQISARVIKYSDEEGASGEAVPMAHVPEDFNSWVIPESMKVDKMIFLCIKNKTIPLPQRNLILCTPDSSK